MQELILSSIVKRTKADEPAQSDCECVASQEVVKMKEEERRFLVQIKNMLLAGKKLV